MNASEKNKLTMRDIITVTLLTVCNVVLYFIASAACVIPVMLAMFPALIALIEGIVFVVIGIKVPKRGAYFIYAVVHGIFGFYLPYFIGYILAGVLAEILLTVMGYGRTKAICTAYVLTQLIGCFTSAILPYKISLQATIERNQATGTELIEAAGGFLTTGIVVLLLVLTVVTAATGVWIGCRVMTKHRVLSDGSKEGRR